tara:strand:+ start:1680 stop:2696 length:1017 start_codon:yes stop_codon:yes gene_type:complete
MCKKLIFSIVILIFVGCNKNLPKSKGEFNDIIIVSSLEDKQLLEPLIDEYIFDYIIHTPEPELAYKKNWITPEGFKYYKEYSNIIIASISDPADKSIDKLMDNFKISHKIKNFPVTISEVFSTPQMITLINESNNQSLKSNLDSSINFIKSTINSHVDSLYLSRYQKSIQNNLDTLQIFDISNLMFDIDLLVSQNFKIIDTLNSKNNLLWIGKGSIDYSNNALYQWLIFKDVDFVDINGNIEMDNLLKNNLELIDQDIEIISNFNKYSKKEYKGKIIYKLNALYNHNLYKTGGPLIAYIIQNHNQKKTLLVYGLINAPGNSKIGLIKELETIIINSIF